MAVGNGTTQHLNWFLEDQDIEFPAYTDPSREAYAAAGMNSGLTGLRLAFIKNARRAKAAGFTQAGTKGDPAQQGGVLVIAAGGEVVYRHADKTGGDHAPMADVLAAVQSLVPG